MGPELFDYRLPQELVAQHPAPRRELARMLVVGPPHRDALVADLPELLTNALVVVNDTRVVPARIRARRDDGRVFELLVCDPRPQIATGDLLTAWVRGARRLMPRDRLRIDEVVLEFVGSEPADRPDASDTVGAFDPSDTADPLDPRGRRFRVVEGELMTKLAERGEVPLPPYIGRPHGPKPDDCDRYQTVFARRPGSVAAPTAGLHLDHDALGLLDPACITLHIGPGTFLPMDVTDVRDHRVGGERFEIDDLAAARITAARRQGRAIVAVGTTVVRALETVAGRHDGAIVACSGTTDLVITPDHRFAVVDALLTNFHLPRSSLLMLVCSFAGRDRVLDAYRTAVERRYRFYSYGDCMLVRGKRVQS